jgi:hypothetical protein
MERKIIGILVIFAVLLALIFSKSGLTVWSTPSRQFNATPNTVYLNWTNSYNSSVTATVNDSFGGVVSITLDNATSSGYSLIFNYTSGGGSCLTGTPCINVIALNATLDTPTNVNLSASGFTPFYLATATSPSSASPGRYTGIFRLYNTSSPSEYANVLGIMDVPVAMDASGKGSFSGTLPPTAISYQSFFVNVSSVVNATALRMNVSWSQTQDIDVFLFDSSSPPKLKAKSMRDLGPSRTLISGIPRSQTKKRFHESTQRIIQWRRVL